MKFVRSIGDENAEINLTPILDCFTVLIAYLLVGGVVAAYSVLDTSIARTPSTAAAGDGNSRRPSNLVEIFFAADGTIFFRGELENRFPPARRAVGTNAPDAPVERALARAAEQLPRDVEVVVSGAPALTYGTFARHVGLVRKYFGAVSLRAP